MDRRLGDALSHIGCVSSHLRKVFISGWGCFQRGGRSFGAAYLDSSTSAGVAPGPGPSMLDMIGSRGGFSSVSLGLGCIEHDGIREAWEVADALVRICQRRTTGHGHSGRGLLHGDGYLLRIHVRGSADPGHGGEEVVVVVAHDVEVRDGSSTGRKMFLSRSRTGRPSSRSRRRQRKARDASFGMLGDFDDERRGSESSLSLEVTR